MFFQKILLKKSFVLFLIYSIVFLSACQAKSNYDSSPQLEGKRILTIATGGTTGPYFAVANGMADLFDQNLEGASVSVRSSGGGVENIQLLLTKKAEFGFVMADIASFAYEGKQIDEKLDGEKLRAITALYPNFIQIITLKGKGVKTVEDLKGKRVGVGDIGSGTEVNARTILNSYDLTYDDIEERYLSYKESVIELKNENIDAAFLTSGLPNSNILELAKTHEVYFIPITEDKIEEIAQEFPYYTSNFIPQYTYYNNNPIPTAAITNILLTTEDIPEDLIYDITKIIFENLEVLRKAHSAAADISLENSQKGLTVPLHDGAKKYFEEEHQLK